MKLCYAAGYLRLGVDGPGGGGLHVEGGVVARPAAGETIPDTELSRRGAAAPGGAQTGTRGHLDTASRGSRGRG